MSYQLADFVSQVMLAVKTARWTPVATRAAELNTITGLLATDPTRLPSTVHRPPVGLRPGSRLNTPFTNKVLEVINRGKGGNLTPLQMGNAITGELSKIFPPVNTSPPVISGTASVGSTLSSTVGNWTYVPTSYLRQWRRGAVPITGATGATYVLVAADSGTTVTMQLIAVNAAGESAPIISNGLAIA
jgi:hypothetical protein